MKVVESGTLPPIGQPFPADPVVLAPAHAIGPAGIISGMMDALEATITAKGYKFGSAIVSYTSESRLWALLVTASPSPLLFRRYHTADLAQAIAEAEAWVGNLPAAPAVSP